MDFLQFPYIIVHRTKTSLNLSALSVSVNSGRLGGFVLVNIYPDMKSSYFYKWMIYIWLFNLSGFIAFVAVVWILQETTKIHILRYIILFIGKFLFPISLFSLMKNKMMMMKFFFFFFHSSSFGIIMQVWWTACFLYMVCIRIYDLCMIELILFKEK